MECQLNRMLSVLSIRGRGRNLKIASFICLLYLFFIHTYVWKNAAPRSSDSGLLNRIFGPRYCKQSQNIVYLKVFKCASTTLSNMFHRYGLENNLSVVLPRQKRIYLGWPYQMKPGYYRPSKTGVYNILCDHAIYNNDIMSSIMPEDTIYVTSLREPYSQFKSMFNYYNLVNIANIPGENPLSEYLHNLPKYEAIYKSHNASRLRYCVPDSFSMSKNLMSNTLGFPTGFPDGALDFTNSGQEILNFIHGIDHDFSLVLIVEYFDESLILLKRLLCWSFKEILYQMENIGTYHYRHDEDVENVALYKNWSYVDHQLYGYFREELLKRISDQRDDFKGEVALLKEVNKKVSNFCSKLKVDKLSSHIVIEASRWSEEFQVNKNFCQMLANMHLLDVAKQQYDNIPILWEDSVPDVEFC